MAGATVYLLLLWIVPLVVLKMTTCLIQGVVYHRLVVVYGEELLSCATSTGHHLHVPTRRSAGMYSAVCRVPLHLSTYTGYSIPQHLLSTNLLVVLLVLSTMYTAYDRYVV